MLWGRSGNRCCMCRCELVIGASETDDESVIGDEAHIVAQSPDGPRGDSPLTSEQRDKYDNLMVLCKIHHKQIDDQPNEFTVEKLHEIKSSHERWIRESLQEYDRQKQRDDEIYAGYIEEWERKANLNDWQFWTSFVLSEVQPGLHMYVDEGLTDLRHWILSRVWPKRYEELEAAFENFRSILSDFQEIFYMYAEPSGKIMLKTHRFYKTTNWDEKHYRQLKREYDFHVHLVLDLFLELTRATNYICDMVRRYIYPTYRLHEGVLLVGDLDSNTLHGLFRSEYKGEERILYPYPGLKQYLVERKNRDYCFGIDADENDPVFLKYIS